MSSQPRRVKIWYQSFVDPDQQSAYCKTLAEALNGMAGQEVRFDVHGIVPPDLELHRLTEFRCARQVIRHAVEAQRQGYDAFAIGHFQDGGLYEARSAVDIPVLGLGEAAMLYACTLGQKIARVTINPVFIPLHEGADSDFTVGKALVLNCIAVLAKMTETAVALNRFNGTAASRLATFQKPSAKALREFLDN